MSFIFVPQPTPTRRARDLGGRLADVIGQYRRENPRLSGTDVRQALRIASDRESGQFGPMAPILVAGAMVLLLLGLAFFYRASGGNVGQTQDWPFIAGVVGVIVVVLALKLARRTQG